MAEQRVSRASDVFALGVVLYECVAREAPWRGLTNADAAHRVMGGAQLVVPNELASTELVAVIESCLCFGASERPSATKVVAALRSLDMLNAVRVVVRDVSELAKGAAPDYTTPPSHPPTTSSKNVEITRMRRVTHSR